MGCILFFESLGRVKLVDLSMRVQNVESSLYEYRDAWRIDRGAVYFQSWKNPLPVVNFHTRVFCKRSFRLSLERKGKRIKKNEKKENG